MAYESEGEIRCGVIYNPVFDELFYAMPGDGAFLNGTRLTISATTEMKQALLVTGFPYDLNTNPRNNIDNFIAFLHKAQAIRRDGSAALNLSYVAAGRFDGFWELKLNPWDTAAGVLMVREAGGAVTDFVGDPFDIYRGGIVASNGLIHADMLKVLEEAR